MFELKNIMRIKQIPRVYALKPALTWFIIVFFLLFSQVSPVCCCFRLKTTSPCTLLKCLLVRVYSLPRRYLTSPLSETLWDDKCSTQKCNKKCLKCIHDIDIVRNVKRVFTSFLYFMYLPFYTSRTWFWISGVEI